MCCLYVCPPRASLVSSEAIQGKVEPVPRAVLYLWSGQTLRGLHGHTGQVGLEPWLGTGWEVGGTTEGNLCVGLNKLESEFRNGVATPVVEMIRSPEWLSGVLSHLPA